MKSLSKINRQQMGKSHHTYFMHHFIATWESCKGHSFEEFKANTIVNQLDDQLCQHPCWVTINIFSVIFTMPVLLYFPSK